MQTAEQPRNKRRKDARPQEILQAALELFIEKGFAAAKMEDIARAAGVTRGTPYLYFANKEEIFKSLITELLLPQLELGEAILSEHKGSTRELLVSLLQAWWVKMGESSVSALPRLILAEAGNFPDVACLYHEGFIQPGLRLIRQVLERGVARGEMRPLDIDMACHVVVSPIMMFMISCHSAAPKCIDVEEPERYIAAAIDILLNGVLLNGEIRNA